MLAQRESSLAGLVQCAGEYGLTKPQAHEIAHEVVETTLSVWLEVADHVEMTEVERNAMYCRQILNPAATRGLIPMSAPRPRPSSRGSTPARAETTPTPNRRSSASKVKDEPDTRI